MSRPYVPEHIDVKIDRLVNKLPGMNRTTMTVLLLDSVLSDIDEDEVVKRFRKSLVPQGLKQKSRD